MPSHDEPSVAYEFDGYRLEPGRRALTEASGAVVKLTGKPFDALVYLVEHAGKVVDRAAMVQAVWPRRVVEDNNLNQAIGVLRHTLGDRHIATVPGRGYQFVTRVRRSADVGEATGKAAGPRSVDSPGARAVPAPSGASHRRLRIPWPVVGVMVVGIGAAAVFASMSPITTSSPPLGGLLGLAPVTSDPGEEATPALSPDGTLVVFARHGAADQRGLYVVEIASGATRRLTGSTHGFDHYPAWSPNGKSIAFLRQYDQARFDLMVVPASGSGDAERLSSGERFWISVEGFPLLVWTPDGREIWFTTKVGDSGSEFHFGLHRLELATGLVTPVPLANEPQHYDSSPAISPDGRWFAFTRYRRSDRLNRILLQRLGPDFAPLGEPQPIDGLDPAIYHSLSWSPSSDRLRFASGAQLLERSMDGAVRVVHTVGPGSSIVAMTIADHGAATRAVMVDVHRDLDLLALPLDPTTHAATGPFAARAKSTGLEQHPRFSPDGRRLAFVSDRSGGREVYVAASNGDNARKLTDVPELIVGYPRWSPDGSRLAFHASSSTGGSRAIYSVDVATGVTKRLFEGCCPGGWSADERALYVSAIDTVTRVLRIDVGDGRSEVLFEGEGALESADGRYLLYSKSRERGYFRRLLPAHAGLEFGAEERLVTDYVPSRGGIAPVADGFFYVSVAEDAEPRAVRFYDYALRQARDIAPTPADIGIGLTASPDGRELVIAGVAGTAEADVVLLEFER